MPTPLLLLLSTLSAGPLLWAQSYGVFDGAGDIGDNPKAGSHVVVSPTEYRVTGGGANVWGAADAFYFLWKRVPADVTLSAAMAFPEPGGDPHRKAVLMIRQSLDAGSAYSGVTVHGDGLTSMQYRTATGGQTQETRFEFEKGQRFRLERRGDRVTVYAATAGSDLLVAIGPRDLGFSGPAYVGIGVSAHNAGALETGVFTSVQFDQPRPRLSYRGKIAIYDVDARTSTIIHEADGVIEAPNWSRDGKHLLVNAGGDLYRIAPVKGAAMERVSLSPGGPYRANNDHDYSSDGRWLAFSASTPQSRQSQVYAAKADGTEVRLLTPAAPSYFHGWSPDGKWLAFVGQRGGKFELFRVPLGGGAEQRLTAAGAYDDGPDYSPDGKWIYFNSNRNGGWDIWRIPASGGGGAGDPLAERITSDEWEDWFPHPSPNGKLLVWIAFPKGAPGHGDRMEGMALRLAKMPGRSGVGKIETVTTFFGGQGSFNVNSWSPDSKRFGYVIYEPAPCTRSTAEPCPIKTPPH